MIDKLRKYIQKIKLTWALLKANVTLFKYAKLSPLETRRYIYDKRSEKYKAGIRKLTLALKENYAYYKNKDVDLMLAANGYSKSIKEIEEELAIRKRLISDLRENSVDGMYHTFKNNLEEYKVSQEKSKLYRALRVCQEELIKVKQSGNAEEYKQKNSECLLLAMQCKQITNKLNDIKKNKELVWKKQ
jgi:hypothetical protein